MKLVTCVAIILVFLTPTLLCSTNSTIIMNDETSQRSLLSGLDGWGYGKTHTIEGSPGAGSNYQVRITVHYGTGTDSGADVYCGTNCKSDFGDLRFTEDDGTTLLDYWIESSVASDYAIIWVEISDNLDADQVIQMQYGNSSATSISDGDTTFPFFDDFNDGVNNPAKWLEHFDGGSFSESSGELRLTGSDSAWEALGAKTQFSGDVAFHYRVKWDEQNKVIVSADDRSATGLFQGSGLDRGAWMYSDGKLYQTLIEGTIMTDFARTSTITDYTSLELRWESGSKMVFLEDGTSVLTSTTNIPTDTLGVEFEVLNLGSDLYVDWTFVRNWIETEPSHGSWGIVGTETQTTTTPPLTTTPTPAPTPLMDLGIIMIGGVAAIVIVVAVVIRSRKPIASPQQSYDW